MSSPEPLGERFVSDALAIMATALGRNNANDPNASPSTFLTYLNDFYSLSMPNDTKLFESFGTMTFVIDQTHADGVYTMNEVGAQFQFENLSATAFISLYNPVNSSVSWNWLPIYQDPAEFFMIWGVNNIDILIPGYPTGVLYYGNEFTFRTIPDQQYQVTFYGYTKNADFPEDVLTPGGDVQLPYDYWLRYIAYGAAVNYARDYRFSPESRSLIEATFKSERKLQLTHAHNQAKMSRSMPRF